MVWNAALARLSILSEWGAFVRSRQLDLEAVAGAFPMMLQIRPESRWALVDENRLLAFDYAFGSMPEEGPSRPRVTFVVLQMDGLIADSLGEYGGIEQTRLPRSGGRAVQTLDPEDTYYAVTDVAGHIYVGDSGSNHIDRFDASGALDLRIELRNVDTTPDADRLAEAQARLVERLERSGLEGMAGPVADMAAGEDAPTFRGLAADDENRLWVRWGQQTASTEARYAVFDALGMPVGTILLPPHERILAISAGRLVLLHRSPLGVETLGVYALAE